MAESFISRITAGDISNVVDPTTVERLGFAEVVKSFEEEPDKEYTDYVYIGVENGVGYREITPLKLRFSRVLSINHALEKKGFFLANCHLAQTIVNPNMRGYNTTSYYSGDLYRERQTEGSNE